VAGLAIATQAAAQVTFYESPNFAGRSFTTQERVGDFSRFGFNDRASSVIVTGEPWEVCDDARFRGRCMVLRPGRYPSLAAMGLNDRVSSVREMRRNERIEDNRYAPAPLLPQITFYENENFAGATFTADRSVGNFQEVGFNDRASSVVIVGDQWELCEHSQFAGQCVVLQPGRYPSLATMGMNNRVSSVRDVSRNMRADNDRYAPPMEGRDFRRRNNELLYEANVVSARAVVGAPEQRCWVEQDRVPNERSDASAPGAVVGAILGGILGHQVGGGRGQGVATVGGAVAGAVVGGNVGRGPQQVQTRDVQRCESAPPQTRPAYWDVTYNFRGQEHHMQMVEPPGRTVTVNERGEPRA
jgi:uncharacterized protein YcfJ